MKLPSPRYAVATTHTFFATGKLINVEAAMELDALDEHWAHSYLKGCARAE